MVHETVSAASQHDPAPSLTASFGVFPAFKAGDVNADIATASPVPRFHLVHDGLLLAPNVPNFAIRTSAPQETVYPMIAKTPSTGPLEAAWPRPDRSTIRPTNTAFFIRSPTPSPIPALRLPIRRLSGQRRLPKRPCISGEFDSRNIERGTPAARAQKITCLYGRRIEFLPIFAEFPRAASPVPVARLSETIPFYVAPPVGNEGFPPRGAMQSECVRRIGKRPCRSCSIRGSTNRRASPKR